MKRASLSDAMDVFDHVYVETGSRELAFYAAMKMFSVNARGQVERAPTRYVLEAVCEFYGVGLADLLSRARPGRLARARNVAMALLRASGERYDDAGAAVARSKADAVRACQRVQGDEVLSAEAKEVAALAARKVGAPAEKLPVIMPSSGRASG